MRLAIAGPSGVGKTTVGKLLAQSRRLSFVDLDARIGDPAAIFAAEGEAGFRARESAALHEVAAEHDVVLALGGGAVRPDMSMLAGWRRVVLLADVDTLVARIGDGAGRPLLQGDVRAAVARLRAQRMASWTAFGLKVHTDALDPVGVVRRLEALW